MTVAYAPFDNDPGPLGPPVFYRNKPNVPIPVKQGNECSYLVMFMVAGVFFIALADSLRN
jgi:hypothetical protein